MGWLNWVARNGLEAIAGTLMAVLAVDMLAGVFWRYVLGASLHWYDEVGRHLFIWMSFLGAAIAVKRNSHFGVDILVARFPPLLRLIAAWFSHLCILVFSAVILFHGINLVGVTRTHTTSALGYSLALVYAALPVGAALMILFTIRNGVMLYRHPYGPRHEPSVEPHATTHFD